MNGPSDNWRLIFTVLYAAWVIVFAYAFVAYNNAPYEGAGFPDGLYKPAVFLGWQGIAGALAFAVFGVSRVWPRGASARTLGNIPLIIAALLAAAVVGFVIWTERA